MLPVIHGDHEAWRYTLISGVIPALPLILIRPFLPESPVWAEKKAAGTLRRPSLRALFSPELIRATVATTLVFAASYGIAFGAIQQLPQILGAQLLPADKGGPKGHAAVIAVAKEAQAEAVAAAKEAGKELPPARLKAIAGNASDEAVARVTIFQEIGGLVGRVLLAFAAIDDVFGLLVIAFAYTASVQPVFLGVAAAAYLGIVGLLRLRWVASIPYVLLGALVWIGVFGSGVHPTIAGVAVGLLLPTRSRLSHGDFAERVERPLGELRAAQSEQARAGDAAEADEKGEAVEAKLGYIHEMVAATDEAAERLVRILTPWVSYVVLPLFALSNVRVHLSSDAIAEALHAPLSLGIVAGLAIGKPLGFMASTWIATRVLGARLPDGVTWRMVLGIGGVAGIGFTLSLFITELAFTDVAQTEMASLAILCASLVSGLFGYAIFWLATRSAERVPDR
jgi:Na+/H+ antiporter NhaA